MNEVVEEWIIKAELDYNTAEREYAVIINPNFDAVCFHYQQCNEKLMKGLIIALGEIPPKTHNLELLNKIISGKLTYWTAISSDLRLLTHAASDFRYPGETATKSIADQTRVVGQKLRIKLLSELTRIGFKIDT